MQQPWYLRPAALKVLRRLRANPPQRVFERDKASRNYHDGSHVFAGYDAIALRALFAREFEANQTAEVLNSNADEVLAALFGDPDNLDWAHPNRADRRAAMAFQINQTLDRRAAA